MVENTTIPASRSKNRSSSRTWLAEDLERHFLSSAKRLFLAHAAKGSAALENGLPLFPAVAAQWYLGASEPPVARKRRPSASVLDSQSIKTSEGGLERGFDAGKQVTGRKRHTLVDTVGLLMKVVVTAGNVQDRDGAKQLLEDLAKQQQVIKRLKLIWADGSYRGALIDWVKEFFDWTLEIVEKPKDQKGFQALPKRWIVERTFAWLVRQRRLARDYERLPQTSEAFIYAAMIRLMIRRLAK